jgi:hypothetical protein
MCLVAAHLLVGGSKKPVDIAVSGLGRAFLR